MTIKQETRYELARYPCRDCGERHGGCRKCGGPLRCNDHSPTERYDLTGICGGCDTKKNAWLRFA